MPPDYVVHAAWLRAAQRWETVMEIHSTLRLACLAAVLAAGFAGMAYEAKAGGLKGGANTASPGTRPVAVKGNPTVTYPGPVFTGPPKPPERGAAVPRVVASTDRCSVERRDAIITPPPSAPRRSTAQGRRARGGRAPASWPVPWKVRVAACRSRRAAVRARTAETVRS